MRIDHFERLRPLCPACRAAGRGLASPLALGSVALRAGDEVIEGVLVCTERLCQREHPIIDGIPIVVADIAAWAAHQLAGVLRRDDLGAVAESLLGDAAGPASELHRERSNLGIYGWSHWGDLAPPGVGDHGGAYAALVAEAYKLAAAGDAVAGGVWVDLGCSVGRGTIELARRGAALAVGVDLNFAMLRVAERVRRRRRVTFALKRVGVVFERFDHEVADVPAECISLWCSDVALLPFGAQAMAGALLLNLLDCVASPLALLAETGRVVAPGGVALYSSPYDWSAQATGMEHWLGGHSQRGAAGGSSVAELRRILSADCAAGVDTGLVIEAERDPVPWRLRTGERSSVDYALHMARLRRKP
jgi:SAM-dependent methyltransferase